MTQGTERLIAGVLTLAVTTAGGIATRYFEQRASAAQAAQNFGAERVDFLKAQLEAAKEKCP